VNILEVSCQTTCLFHDLHAIYPQENLWAYTLGSLFSKETAYMSEISKYG
jgi:hypothetical protein